MLNQVTITIVFWIWWRFLLWVRSHFEGLHQMPRKVNPVRSLLCFSTHEHDFVVDECERSSSPFASLDNQGPHAYIHVAEEAMHGQSETCTRRIGCSQVLDIAHPITPDDNARARKRQTNTVWKRVNLLSTLRAHSCMSRFEYEQPSNDS